MQHDGLGFCIAIDPMDAGDRELTSYAIDKLKSLLGTAIEKSDIKINNSIYPRQSELDNNEVSSCATDQIAFCYQYKPLDESKR